MACGSCGRSKTASGYLVKRPGQSNKVVATELQAQNLTRGVAGATYSAVAK